MIVVTGGAGFIGSALIWKLNSRGIEDILIVDKLGTAEKWRNLVSLKYLDFQDKSEFIDKLESGFYKDSITAILHMGACSSTTETDADYLMENNFHYSVRLARWWKNHQSTRFIYASSAATYGDGRSGYSDDYSMLYKLRPLNMYGYSKHLFDCYAFREGWLKKITGLKFFNVFGPNEYHKGEMRSLINKAYSRVRDEGVMSLFKSYNPQYRDGEQKRDFIYIKDVVEMVLFFMDNPDTGGLFNIGTG
jgi:ADP-L-glycero-D-manno-heptose 6-epimerase